MPLSQRYEWKKTFANGDTYFGEATDGDVKDGQGTYFWTATGVTYKGTWCNDQPHGQGTMTDPGAEGYTYSGSFVCGKRCGRGECRFGNGRVYIGEWLDDRIEGQGILRGGSADSFQEYRGPFLKGVRSGPKGQCVYKNGDRYEGEWLGDMRHGMGDWALAPGPKKFDLLARASYTENDPFPHPPEPDINERSLPPLSTSPVVAVERYKGLFERDMPTQDSNSELTYADGSTFVGVTDAHLRRNGEGQHRMSNGDVYVGQFYCDAREGRGVLRCAADGSSYDGTWKHGELDGFLIYHRPYPTPRPRQPSTGGGEVFNQQPSSELPVIVDYKGPCVHGKLTGSKAALTFSDRSTYNGDVCDGKPSGYGVLENRLMRGCFPQNAFGPEVLLLRYEGCFSEGEPNGDGFAMLRIALPDDLPSGVSAARRQALTRPASIPPGAKGLRWRFNRSGTFRGQWSRGLPEGVGEWLWEGGGGRYKGEMYLGLPSGKGLYESGHERYEGYFKQGLPSGYGTYQNFLTCESFEGDWLLGLYHGLGKWCLRASDSEMSTLFASVISSYEGSWQDGKRNGCGLDCSENEIYEGEFKDGMRHGHGTLRHFPDDGYCYDGDFSHGRMSGSSGKLTLPNKIVVNGPFDDGVPHGVNIHVVFPQGFAFRGQYDHGFPVGVGDITYANGDHYRGEVKPADPATGPQDWAPQRHGKGVYTFVEGNRLECTWQHNILHGYGKHITYAGEVSERHYADGVILSKAAPGSNVFTFENEFPNTQSAEALKEKLQVNSQPHKFMRRGEIRQAVKGVSAAALEAVPSVKKKCVTVNAASQEIAAPAAARREAPDAIKTRSVQLPRRGTGPVPCTATSSKGDTNSLSSAVTGKRVSGILGSPPPHNHSAKTVAVGASGLGKNGERGPKSSEAVNDPACFPGWSAECVAELKAANGASNSPGVRSHKIASKEPYTSSSLPRKVQPSSRSNSAMTCGSTLDAFQKLIRRLNDDNDDLQVRDRGNANGEKTCNPDSVFSSVQLSSNGVGKTSSGGIMGPSPSSHYDKAPNNLHTVTLGALVREASKIRSSREDEIYTLTEDIRSLNAKIWQLRFYLSSNAVSTVSNQDNGTKNDEKKEADNTKWQLLEALQLERLGIVEALRSILAERSVDEM